MHIEKLLIQNFRGLQEIALNFPQNNLAVFIGTNGAGKSSILDCIAIMLAQFIARLRNSKKLEMRFTENDININSNFTANTITILAGQGNRLSWKMTQERVYTQNKSNYDDINDYIKRLQETLKLQPNLNLPVMVYYQTHRMILKNPYTFKSKGSNKVKKEAHYQLHAYEKAFGSIQFWQKHQNSGRREISTLISNIVSYNTHYKYYKTISNLIQFYTSNQ